MLCKNTVVCVYIFITIVVVSHSQPTQPPWQPQIQWDRLGFEGMFPKPFTEGSKCNQLNQTSTTYFCDPNKILSNADVTKSLAVLSASVGNGTAGLIVINGIRIIRSNVEPDVIESEIINDTLSFSTISFNQWSSSKGMPCDACILLFVSCNDSTWYEARGSEFLSGIPENCRYLFNSTSPVINPNVADGNECYKHLIKPRLDIYAELQAGKHMCQPTPGPGPNVIGIVIGVIIAILVVIVPVVVYIYLKRRKTAKAEMREMPSEMQSLKA